MQDKFSTIQEGIDYVAAVKTKSLMKEFRAGVVKEFHKLHREAFGDAGRVDSHTEFEFFQNAQRLITEIRGGIEVADPEKEVLRALFTGIRERITERLVTGAIGETPESFGK